MITDQQFIDLSNQVTQLAETFASWTKQANESTKGQLDMDEQLWQQVVLTRQLLNIDHFAIFALASNHPDKPAVRATLQKLWNGGRSALGMDTIPDSTREAVQQHLQQLAQILGGPIL